MERSSKSAWLDGPGDLREADVEDVPVEGQSVRVRGLPAAISTQASSVEPSFTVEEAEKVAEKYGPAFRKVVAEVDRLSGIDKEAIEEANARFQGSGERAPDKREARVQETPNGSGGPAVPARAGA